MNKYMSGVIYNDDQALGAWGNGVRVVKTRKIDEIEALDIGSVGTVLGSVALPKDAIQEQKERGLDNVEFCYWIEFDVMPKLPVICIDKKLGLVQ